MTGYSIRELREAWLRAALHEWEQCVKDDERGVPGDRDVITGYFEACGWGFHIPGGYVERADNPWCGLFAGAMGMRVGEYLSGDRCEPVRLDLEVARLVMPSTTRLASSTKWKATGAGLPVRFAPAVRSTQYRDMSVGLLHEAKDVLVPGAIATVRTSGKKPEVGDHIVIIESYDEAGKTIATVEGNGRGRFPDGDRGEGVVRCNRPARDVRRVYHLCLEHFEELERP